MYLLKLQAMPQELPGHRQEREEQDTGPQNEEKARELRVFLCFSRVPAWHRRSDCTKFWPLRKQLEQGARWMDELPSGRVGKFELVSFDGRGQVYPVGPVIKNLSVVLDATEVRVQRLSFMNVQKTTLSHYRYYNTCKAASECTPGGHIRFTPGLWEGGEVRFQCPASIKSSGLLGGAFPA